MIPASICQGNGLIESHHFNKTKSFTGAQRLLEFRTCGWVRFFIWDISPKACSFTRGRSSPHPGASASESDLDGEPTLGGGAPYGQRAFPPFGSQTWQAGRVNGLSQKKRGCFSLDYTHQWTFIWFCLRIFWVSDRSYDACFQKHTHRPKETIFCLYFWEVGEVTDSRSPFLSWESLT